jgi:hypothetical protein
MEILIIFDVKCKNLVLGDFVKGCVGTQNKRKMIPTPLDQVSSQLDKFC